MAEHLIGVQKFAAGLRVQFPPAGLRHLQRKSLIYYLKEIIRIVVSNYSFLYIPYSAIFRFASKLCLCTRSLLKKNKNIPLSSDGRKQTHCCLLKKCIH